MCMCEIKSYCMMYMLSLSHNVMCIYDITYRIVRGFGYRIVRGLVAITFGESGWIKTLKLANE